MECTKVVGLMNSERRHSRNLLLKLTAKREKRPIIKKKKDIPNYIFLYWTQKRRGVGRWKSLKKLS